MASDDRRAIAQQHVRWAIDMQRRPELHAQESPHATINNPEWFRAGRPLGGRADFHEQITTDLLAEHPGVKQEKRAVVLAGPPGAGKSRIIGDRGKAGEVPQYDPDTFITVDADFFKERLLSRALADGTYQEFIKPDFVKDLERDGEVFSPLEMASLVHEESSMLAKAARNELASGGYNMVLDTVLSTERAADDIGQVLSAHGYTVTVIDVEVPAEMSKTAVQDRWREGYEGMLAGDPNKILGGRWVPSEYVDAVFKDGVSQPQKSAAHLAETNSNVIAYQSYERTMKNPQRAEVVSDQVRQKVGGPLLDRQSAANHNKISAATRSAFSGSVRDAAKAPLNRANDEAVRSHSRSHNRSDRGRGE